MCGLASAYCQLMDALYPGQVPLHKVKFDAKLEHEFVANFKVLQSLFDKFGIDRVRLCNFLSLFYLQLTSKFQTT
jgi:RP/EB family microtubule-associated protein